LLFHIKSFAQDEVTPPDQVQRLMQFAANNADFDANVTAQAKASFQRQFPGCTPVTQVVRQLPEALGELQFPLPCMPGYSRRHPVVFG